MPPWGQPGAFTRPKIRFAQWVRKIISRAGGNYTKQANPNAIGFESTDFWHRLNATRQIKCTSIHYVAFNLPIVAFTLSGDPGHKKYVLSRSKYKNYLRLHLKFIEQYR